MRRRLICEPIKIASSDGPTLQDDSNAGELAAGSDRSMLDATIHPRQPRRRQGQLPQPQRHGRRRSRRRSSTTSASGSSRRRRSLQQRQNEISKLIPKEKDPAKKQALIAGGQASCASRSAGLETQLKQVEADLQRRPADHPQHDAPRRPGRHARRRTTRSSRTLGRAAQVRLQAEGPRRPGRGARPGRLRGRRRGRRAEVLLPQERGGAAGTGPGAVRHADAGQARATRRSSRPTWPASRCWKASASCRAARRRRSTPSRTPTCA